MFTKQRQEQNSFQSKQEIFLKVFEELAEEQEIREDVIQLVSKEHESVIIRFHIRQ